MTQRSVPKNLKTFFHEVAATGFVYNPITFLSLDVLSSPSTWSWSSRKRMQKPGIACYRTNAVMHTLMDLSPWYFRFLWQTGALQYADTATNTDTLFLDRELETQVNTEKPGLPWHHVCQVVEMILLYESLPLWPAALLQGMLGRIPDVLCLDLSPDLSQAFWLLVWQTVMHVLSMTRAWWTGMCEVLTCFLLGKKITPEARLQQWTEFSLNWIWSSSTD